MRIPVMFASAWLAAILPSRAAPADIGSAPATRPAAATVALPGHPFGVACSADANWVFVSILADQPAGTGIAVLKLENGQYELKRVIPLNGDATGIVLTHDGKALVAAEGDSVAVLDTGRMISGLPDPVIATFSDGAAPGSVYVNVTSDDKVLFVSDEDAECITVIDLDRVRSGGFGDRAVIGKIPVGLAPIALSFSPDGHWLYTTSEIAPPAWGWPNVLKPERTDPNQPDAMVPEGAVVVVDVAQARIGPAHSVIARVPAGASPVRMVISADGRRVYVTARGSNAVLVFDAGKLISDSAHARLAAVTVGSSPVPLALIQGGRTLVVGNSSRFGADADKPQTLSVLDVAGMEHGAAPVGTIAAGSFPREMCVSPDGGILFLSNFGSDSLEVIDARNPPVERR
jgi:DNA-binding beta-propeller fold protein YncE